MQRLDHDRLRRDLAIWLRLIPQGVRREWCERHTYNRDAAADAIARRLAEHLRNHEVWAPDPLLSVSEGQGWLALNNLDRGQAGERLGPEAEDR